MTRVVIQTIHATRRPATQTPNAGRAKRASSSPVPKQINPEPEPEEQFPPSITAKPTHAMRTTHVQVTKNQSPLVSTRAKG